MKRPRGGPSRFRSIASIAGRCCPPKRSGEREPPIAAAPRIDFGLDRRRRRRQHDRDVVDVRAHHRHVARMIVHAVFLLVGGVVLLIDHDQAEIGIWQKQRRARADHDVHFAGRDRASRCARACARELGVPFGRADAEACCEAIEELRRERDLGHQDQRLAALPDRLGDRLEIDLGLARAGDAVEQRRRRSRRAHARRAGCRPPCAAPR